MPGRTHGEKIDELTRVQTVLAERVARLREKVKEHSALPTRIALLEQQVVDLKKGFEAIARVEAALAKLGDAVATLTTRMAVVEHQIADLRKARDETSRKRWSVVGPVVGALVNGLIAAAVAYFVARP